MKITNKQFRLLSGLFYLLGALVVVYTKVYNKNHPEDPNSYGLWIGIVLIILGMVFLIPWNKK